MNALDLLVDFSTLISSSGRATPQTSANNRKDSQSRSSASVLKQEDIEDVFPIRQYECEELATLERVNKQQLTPTSTLAPKAALAAYSRGNGHAMQQQNMATDQIDHFSDFTGLQEYSNHLFEGRQRIVVDPNIYFEDGYALQQTDLYTFHRVIPIMKEQFAPYQNQYDHHNAIKERRFITPAEGQTFEPSFEAEYRPLPLQFFHTVADTKATPQNRFYDDGVPSYDYQFEKRTGQWTTVALEEEHIEQDMAHDDENSILGSEIECNQNIDRRLRYPRQ